MSLPRPRKPSVLEQYLYQDLCFEGLVAPPIVNDEVKIDLEDIARQIKAAIPERDTTWETLVCHPTIVDYVQEAIRRAGANLTIEVCVSDTVREDAIYLIAQGVIHKAVPPEDDLPE